MWSITVRLMKSNDAFEAVVSVDGKGMVEYWSANDFAFPSSTVKFAYKTDTDLYEFAKCKTLPVSLEFSPDGRLFATMSHDRQVRACAHASRPHQPPAASHHRQPPPLPRSAHGHM